MNESDNRLKAQYTIRQETVQLSAATPVRQQRMQVPVDVPPHDHDYYEICLVHSGRAMHRTSAYAQAAEAGTAIVVPPGDVHGFARVRGLEVTNVYYLAEWLLDELRAFWDQDGLVPLFLAQSLFRRGESRAIPQFTLRADETRSCLAELRDLEAESKRSSPSVVYLKSAFTKFLILLSRAFVRGASREMGFAFRQEVWSALDYVEQSIEESTRFSVEALSQRVGFSPDHVSRVFKQATGRAPMDYFQQRRVQRASLMLLNPRHSATDVAHALGFSDSAHFTRLFRRYHGLSPREYRKMYLPREVSARPAEGPSQSSQREAPPGIRDRP